MNIKLTRNTPVEPLVAGAYIAAQITRESQLFTIGRGEGKVKRVRVGRMGDRKWFGSTENMEIEVTDLAMVAESVSLLSTSITSEEATWVDAGGEEGEGVLGVRWVGD